MWGAFFSHEETGPVAGPAFHFSKLSKRFPGLPLRTGKRRKPETFLRMNPQELNTLHILHVLSVLGLTGATFYAFAGAPASRKRVMMWSGIASLLVLLTGLRMWQQLYHFHAGWWLMVKFVCWLGLS